MRWSVATSGLFARLLALCLGMTMLVVIITIASFHTYRTDLSSNRNAAELASLSRAVAPIIEAELANERPRMAERALRMFAGLQYVVCADYIKNDVRRAAWPPIGCDGLGLDAAQSVQMSVPSRDGNATFINLHLNNDLLEQRVWAQTTSFVVPLLIVVLVVFLVVAVVFGRIVLAPLGLLKTAMMESTPRGPVRAKFLRDDEIGALVKVYNKLVASSRIYIRRLDQSQLALEASERRFRDLAEVSGDWFFEMDDALKMTFLSDRFYQITGLHQADVIGKARHELTSENMNALSWQWHFSDLDAHREFKRFEYQLECPNGKMIDVSVSGVPLHDDSGVFTGYRGVGNDISLIKEKERQLAETNRNFGDSVTYASSIQRRLLCSSEALSAYLGNARVVWQPKDLVGGDFYWAKTIADVQYLVFFDCTGHGVPGAFMTLIVTSVLDQIAVSAPSALPATKMLQLVHEGVCTQLGITFDMPGKDGLDCAVVRLNRDDDSLEFAGASIDLYVIDPAGGTTRHRGSRKTIGYEMHAEPISFESARMDAGDNCFVMTTDGLLTQIGEETGRVLGTRRFEAALGDVPDNKPATLIRTMARLLKNWQGRQERRDDVSFIAFRPNDQ
ncbi:PAS domain S-box protein [Alphaproteobacteria bacterium]|nr:PAS domain S-box protein [Alphaproteobacteria bacterium]